jgi:hypothetical protein
MRTRRFVLVLGSWLAVTVVAAPTLAHAPAAPPGARPLRLVPLPPPRALSVPTIDFAELYRFGSRAPELSSKLLALQGRRVMLVGFMVLLERPPRGGFYLSPLPAASDESGAGRGDLPPTSVLVLPRAAAGRPVSFVPGALEITGVLDVGNREIDGEPSTVRLLLDGPSDLRFARTRRTAGAARKTAKGEGR